MVPPDRFYQFERYEIDQDEDPSDLAWVRAIVRNKMIPSEFFSFPHFRPLLKTPLDALVSLWLSNVCDLHVSFERLWNFARETFAPIWSLSKVFVSTNFVIKSFQNIWSENSQKRRPRGSSIKRGEIRPAKFGQMCLPQIFQVYLLHLSELSTLFFPVYSNGMTLK